MPSRKIHSLALLLLAAVAFLAVPEFASLHGQLAGKLDVDVPRFAEKSRKECFGGFESLSLRLIQSSCPSCSFAV